MSCTSPDSKDKLVHLVPNLNVPSDPLLSTAARMPIVYDGIQDLTGSANGRGCAMKVEEDHYWTAHRP